MMELLQVSDWRRTLGYLPVPLCEDATEQRFVMLNPVSKFCVGTSRNPCDRPSPMW